MYFNTSYRNREMKREPIILDYCLLQFDALNFFLESIFMGGGGVSLSNFNFFQNKPPNF